MRLPQQLGEALQAATDTARSVDRAVRETLAALRDVASDLERVRSTVEPQHARVAAIEGGLEVLPALAADVERMRATVEPQHERVAAIESGLPVLAAEVERIRETVEPQHLRVEAIQHAVGRLEERLAELQQALQAVEGTVEDATDRLPDPDAPGPLARARDTITGRS